MQILAPSTMGMIADKLGNFKVRMSLKLLSTRVCQYLTCGDQRRDEINLPAFLIIFMTL